MPQVGQPIRIALSGGTQAPGIGEIVQVLGVEEAVRRINAAREMLWPRNRRLTDTFKKPGLVRVFLCLTGNRTDL